MTDRYAVESGVFDGVIKALAHVIKQRQHITRSQLVAQVAGSIAGGMYATVNDQEIPRLSVKLAEAIIAEAGL